MSKSILGYQKGSPYRSEPYLDIFTDSGSIDMSNTDIPLYAEDNTGYKKYLPPHSGMHQFPGTVVREHKMQEGGTVAQQAFNYLFEEDEVAPMVEAPQQQIEVANDPTYEDKNANEQADFESAMRILYDSDTEDPIVGAKAASGVMSNMFNNIYDKVPANILTPESYLKGIGYNENENAKPGEDPKDVPGSASGKYGVTDIGKEDIYLNSYKNKMTYKDFLNKFNSDAEFEYEAAKTLAARNIARSGNDAHLALAMWYAGPSAKKYMNTIPGEYKDGKPVFNKLTGYQYATQALNKALNHK